MKEEDRVAVLNGLSDLAVMTPLLFSRKCCLVANA